MSLSRLFKIFLLTVTTNQLWFSSPPGLSLWQFIYLYIFSKTLQALICWRNSWKCKPPRLNLITSTTTSALCFSLAQSLFSLLSPLHRYDKLADNLLAVRASKSFLAPFGSSDTHLLFLVFPIITWLKCSCLLCWILPAVCFFLVFWFKLTQVNFLIVGIEDKSWSGFLQLPFSVINFS